MIRCNLSRYMGEQRLNISELARETGLNRNTISLLYHDRASRVDLEAIELLCNFFDCEVGDMLQISEGEK